MRVAFFQRGECLHLSVCVLIIWKMEQEKSTFGKWKVEMARACFSTFAEQQFQRDLQSAT